MLTVSDDDCYTALRQIFSVTAYSDPLSTEVNADLLKRYHKGNTKLISCNNNRLLNVWFDNRNLSVQKRLIK